MWNLWPFHVHDQLQVQTEKKPIFTFLAQVWLWDHLFIHPKQPEYLYISCKLASNSVWGCVCVSVWLHAVKHLTELSTHQTPLHFPSSQQSTWTSPPQPAAADRSRCKSGSKNPLFNPKSQKNELWALLLPAASSSGSEQNLVWLFIPIYSSGSSGSSTSSLLQSSHTGCQQLPVGE